MATAVLVVLLVILVLLLSGYAFRLRERNRSLQSENSLLKESLKLTERANGKRDVVNESTALDNSTERSLASEKLPGTAAHTKESSNVYTVPQTGRAVRNLDREGANSNDSHQSKAGEEPCSSPTSPQQLQFRFSGSHGIFTKTNATPKLSSSPIIRTHREGERATGKEEEEVEEEEYVQPFSGAATTTTSQAHYHAPETAPSVYETMRPGGSSTQRSRESITRNLREKGGKADLYLGHHHDVPGEYECPTRFSI